MAIKLEGNGVDYTFPRGFDIRGYSRSVSAPGIVIYGKDGEVIDNKVKREESLSLEVYGRTKSNSLASAKAIYDEISNAVNGLPDEVYLVNTSDDIRIPVHSLRFDHTRLPAKSMQYSIHFKASNPFWEDRSWSKVEFTGQKIVDIPIGNAPLYPRIVLEGLMTNPTIVEGNWSFNSHIYDLKADAMTDGTLVDPYGTITGEYEETSISTLPSAIGSVASLAMNAAFDVAVSSNYAYVVSSVPGAFIVLDISTPETPTILGSVASPAVMGDAQGVAISGNYAYVAAVNADSLTVISISSPATPTILGSVASPAVMNSACKVAVSGNYVYVTAYNSNSLTVLDVSTPETPTILSSIASPAVMLRAYDIAISGNYAYVVSYGSDSLTVISISSPATPTILGSVASPVTLDDPYGVVVSDNYAYVASYSADSLVIIDVSTPETPTILSSIASPVILNGVFDVAVSSNYAYVVSFFTDSLVVIDVSTPATPTILTSVTAEMDGPYGIAMSSDYAYAYIVANTSDSLTVFDLTTISTSITTQAIVPSKYGYGQEMDGLDTYSFDNLYQRYDRISFNVKFSPNWDYDNLGEHYLFSHEKDGTPDHYDFFTQNGRLVFGADSTFGGNLSSFSDAGVEFAGWYDVEGTIIDGTRYYGKLFQDGNEIASTQSTIAGCNATLDKIHIGTNTSGDNIIHGIMDELYLFNQNMGDNWCKGETVSERSLNADNKVFKWTGTISTNDYLNIDMSDYTVEVLDSSIPTLVNNIGSMTEDFFTFGDGAGRTGHDKNKIDTVTFGAVHTGSIRYRKLYW